LPLTISLSKTQAQPGEEIIVYISGGSPWHFGLVYVDDDLKKSYFADESGRAQVSIKAPSTPGEHTVKVESAEVATAKFYVVSTAVAAPPLTPAPLPSPPPSPPAMPAPSLAPAPSPQPLPPQTQPSPPPAPPSPSPQPSPSIPSPSPPAMPAPSPAPSPSPQPPSPPSPQPSPSPPPQPVIVVTSSLISIFNITSRFKVDVVTKVVTSVVDRPTGVLRRLKSVSTRLVLGTSFSSPPLTALSTVIVVARSETKVMPSPQPMPAPTPTPSPAPSPSPQPSPIPAPPPPKPTQWVWDEDLGRLIPA